MNNGKQGSAQSSLFFRLNRVTAVPMSCGERYLKIYLPFVIARS